MDKNIPKIIFTIFITLCGVMCYTKIYAKTDIKEISLEILDKDNNYVTIMPPESGEINGYIDSALNYEGCKYEIILSAEGGNKYENDFVIEGLGTFHFQYQGGGIQDGDSYTEKYYSYTADITDQSILKTGKFSTKTFKVKNLTTETYEYFKIYLLCFKDGFDTNANLSVNGNQFIKNGKIINDYVEIDGWQNSIVYDRVFNTLRVNELNSKNISFENMGKNFIIETLYKDAEKLTIEQYNPYTNVKLTGVGTNSIDYKDLMVVDELISGNVYNTAINTLKDICKNAQIYDISIEKDKVKKQPKGNVKISLPIKKNSDLNNLVVYRIEQDGTKIEYKVQVQTIDGINYATFETNHFSVYVLAEKNTINNKEDEKEEIEKQPQEEQKHEELLKHKLDNEPKTGVINNINELFSFILLTIINR